MSRFKPETRMHIKAAAGCDQMRNTENDFTNV
jgi:hypothetical protein